jgi:hypothetical protein
MAEFGFRLTIEGDIEACLDDLFEAGCDDGTFGWFGSGGEAYFHRDAPSLEAAIASAVADVESVTGLKVTSVELDGDQLAALRGGSTGG